MVNLARKILFHDKIRFFITVSGVGFAVTLVFVQVGLFLGILDNASVTIDHLDADLWVTAHNTPNIDFAATYPETYVQRVRSVPGVARADNLIVWFTKVTLPNGASEGSLVYALENFPRWNFPWNLESGETRDLRRGSFVVMDNFARKRFGPFAVGDYREFVNKRLKIIGKSRNAKSFTTTPLCFIDYKLAQSFDPQNLTGRTTYTIVKLEPGADVEAVRHAIRKALPYNDVHTKAAWAAKSRNYWTESTGLGLNMIMTVCLGCLVGIVVVAQTLYTSTMEHLKEFGTVKAIGGSNLDIYKIIGRQATIAAVIGFAIGTALAFAIRPFMASIDLKLIIPWSLAAYVFLGTVVLCLAASTVSFHKVASLDPAMVFRS